MTFGWQFFAKNIVQQKITINDIDNQIQILGNTTETHLLSLNDLRGYAINNLNGRLILCLYPKEGGLYSVALPLKNGNLEAELHKYLKGTIQMSFFDDMTFRKKND